MSNKSESQIKLTSDKTKINIGLTDSYWKNEIKNTKVRLQKTRVYASFSLVSSATFLPLEILAIGTRNTGVFRTLSNI